MTSRAVLEQYRELRRLIERLETALRRIDLWDEEPPAAQLLASVEPFCFDTLMFHQWLQWRFIPRMRWVLAGHGSLPTESAILPYAADALSGCEGDTSEVLFLIKHFDALISGDVGDAGH